MAPKERDQSLLHCFSIFPLVSYICGYSFISIWQREITSPRFLERTEKRRPSNWKVMERLQRGRSLIKQPHKVCEILSLCLRSTWKDLHYLAKKRLWKPHWQTDHPQAPTDHWVTHTQDKSEGHDKDFKKCPDTGIRVQGKQYGTCGMNLDWLTKNISILHNLNKTQGLMTQYS